uniref:B30.2/SPRY domain-containing protein n=2 Tax=Ascaris TaxID=6251 RepID=A0A0M3HQF2_ASCLU
MKDNSTCSCEALGSTPQQLLPLIAKMAPEYWSWDYDPQVSKNEVLIEDNRVTFHREYSYGTAAVRAKKRLTANTIAYWEIRVPHRLFGTSVMFGIGNDCARHSLVHRFENMLGADSNSYGLSHTGHIFHDGLCVRFCERFPARGSTAVGLMFHGPSASLAYFRDGSPLGVAFSHIDLSRPLYPMISSTAQKSEFILCEQRFLHMTPYSLCECALQCISRLIRNDTLLDSLHLPLNLNLELCERINARTRRRLCMQHSPIAVHN